MNRTYDERYKNTRTTRTISKYRKRGNMRSNNDQKIYLRKANNQRSTAKHFYSVDLL